MITTTPQPTTTMTKVTITTTITTSISRFTCEDDNSETDHNTNCNKTTTAMPDVPFQSSAQSEPQADHSPKPPLLKCLASSCVGSKSFSDKLACTISSATSSRRQTKNSPAAQLACWVERQTIGRRTRLSTPPPHPLVWCVHLEHQPAAPGRFFIFSVPPIHNMHSASIAIDRICGPQLRWTQNQPVLHGQGPGKHPAIIGIPLDSWGTQLARCQRFYVQFTCKTVARWRKYPRSPSCATQVPLPFVV